MLTPDELLRYAEVMHKIGIISFKHDGCEIVVMPLPGSQGKIVDPPREYTPEEIMFAHTEGLPD